MDPAFLATGNASCRPESVFGEARRGSQQCTIVEAYAGAQAESLVVRLQARTLVAKLCLGYPDLNNKRQRERA